MTKNYRSMTLWVAVACFVFLIFQAFNGNRAEISSITYSDFLREVDSGRVAKVTIKGLTIEGVGSDGHMFSTYDPRDPELVKKLLAQAGEKYRDRYELSTHRFDDMRIAIALVLALRRLCVIIN